MIAKVAVLVFALLMVGSNAAPCLSCLSGVPSCLAGAVPPCMAGAVPACLAGAVSPCVPSCVPACPPFASIPLPLPVSIPPPPMPLPIPSCLPASIPLQGCSTFSYLPVC